MKGPNQQALGSPLSLFIGLTIAGVIEGGIFAITLIISAVSEILSNNGDPNLHTLGYQELGWLGLCLLAYGMLIAAIGTPVIVREWAKSD